MDNCVFCLIAEGKIPAAKIWENDKFLAFLSNRPNTKGMTLVIPKQHYDSYIFNLEDEFYQEYLLVVKKIAKILEKALNVKRIVLVAEGLGVNHAHFKLYPVHGFEEEFEGIGEQKEVFFKTFPGYTNTLSGPLVEFEELNLLAEEIKKHI